MEGLGREAPLPVTRTSVVSRSHGDQLLIDIPVEILHPPYGCSGCRTQNSMRLYSAVGWSVINEIR